MCDVLTNLRNPTGAVLITRFECIYYSATVVRGAVGILLCIALQVFLDLVLKIQKKTDVVHSSVGAIPGYLRASYERRAESIMSWNGCIYNTRNYVK